MLPTLSKMNDFRMTNSPGQNGQNTHFNQTQNSKSEEKNVKKAIQGIINLEENIKII